MNLDQILFPDEPRPASRIRRGNGRATTPPSERRAIVALAVLAAVGAVLSPSQPTGYRVSDALLCAGFAAAVVWAMSRSRRWTWFLPSGAAMVLAPDVGWAIVGAVSFGVAVYANLAPSRRRMLGALTGALAVQGLLRLDNLGASLTSALVVCAVLTPVAVSAYRHSPKRVQRQFVIALAVAAAVFMVGSLMLGAVTYLVTDNVTKATASARDGLEAARSGDQERARQALSSSARGFDAAHDLVGAWWMTPARIVPLVGLHERALEVATREGSAITTSAAELANSVSIDDLKFESGRLNLDLVQQLQEPLAGTAADLRHAKFAMAGIESPWLTTPVTSRIRRLDREVTSALPDARLAAEVARIGPGLLGRDGVRRYFVLFTQPAEARGLGGFMGNWAELTARDGKLTMTRSGRTAELRDTPGADERTVDGPDDYVTRYGRFRPWVVLQDVPLSPDFPSVADVMRQVYPQTGGADLDGVIAVDPYALAALMKFTGPIRVEGRTDPLTAENAAEFLLRDQYLTFQDDEQNRIDFLDEASRETFDRLTNGDLPSPRKVSEVLDPVVEEGRLSLYSVRADEQRLFERIGADGAMPSATGDFFSLVTQNAGNNKIDIFLKREVDYRATVDPSTGIVRAQATITLSNTVPGTNLPLAVVGSNDQGLPLGTNKLWFNFYTPLTLTGGTVDGEHHAFSSEKEFGMRVFGDVLSVPAGKKMVIKLDLEGRIDTSRGYLLGIAPQPLINPDEVVVVITPKNGRLEPVNGGLAIDGSGTAGSAQLSDTKDVELRAGFSDVRRH